MRKILILGFLVLGTGLGAQQGAPTSPFIRDAEPVIALTHVELIDGTGAAPMADQTVIIDHGKIGAVGASGSVSMPAGAKVIDGTGKTVIPGMVAMHEHLFYPLPDDEALFQEEAYDFPPLYLASGVTTGRTTGSLEPYADLGAKQMIDSGEMVGPNLDLTAPYLQGGPSIFLQMRELKDANEAREFVRYWHSVGFTSLKAYVNVSPEELRAGIEEAHKLGMKVTGHLCSVGYREAAEMGIDNLEHGPYVAPDGELYSKKVHGVCPTDFRGMFNEIVTRVEPDGPELKETLKVLLAHHVAITSTLAVVEGGLRPPMDRDGLVAKSQQLMTPQAWNHTMTARARESAINDLEQERLTKEMKFEREFVAAGGLLMAGCDPTGDGHALAGLGDQREVELLVEAGFSPAEAIHITTQNGATFLGRADQIGTVGSGKQADLVLLDGDFAKDVRAIERPEIVFKEGKGYDSKAIYDSLRGKIGP
jgi:imidazolonepropionase-like amidohydrolase